MKNKIIKIITIMVITAICFAGCGGNTKSDKSDKDIKTTESTKSTTATTTTTTTEATVPTTTPTTQAETTTLQPQKPEFTYTEMSQTMYAKSTVNVRDLPNSDGNRIGGLNKADEVQVTGQCNETKWYRISYNSGEGFVSNNYLLAEKPVEETVPQNNANSGDTNSAGSTGNEAAITTPETTPAAGFRDDYAEEVLALVNQVRASAGVPPLTMNYTLMNGAHARASELVQYYSHTRPDGRECFTAIKEAGISYMSCGENIAIGQRTPQEVVDAWVGSQGHYENIIRASYTELAVGCYYDPGAPYRYHWVQLFVGY